MEDKCQNGNCKRCYNGTGECYLFRSAKEQKDPTPPSMEWENKWRETFANLYAPDFSWQKLEQRPYKLLYLMEKFIRLMETTLLQEKDAEIARAIEKLYKDGGFIADDGMTTLNNILAALKKMR